MKHKPIEYENDLTCHLILYSKGHYKKTNDILSDLKQLMTNRAALPENYIRDTDVYTFVSECFVDSCTKRDVQTLLRCFYSKPWGLGVGQATLEEMVSHMIGMMACIQIYESVYPWYSNYLPKSRRENTRKLVELVKLEEPDPRYLPIPKPNEKSLSPALAIK